jgi:hypothetical protein
VFEFGGQDNFRVFDIRRAVYLCASAASTSRIAGSSRYVCDAISRDVFPLARDVIGVIDWLTAAAKLAVGYRGRVRVEWRWISPIVRSGCEEGLSLTVHSAVFA